MQKHLNNCGFREKGLSVVKNHVTQMHEEEDYKSIKHFKLNRYNTNEVSVTNYYLDELQKENTKFLTIKNVLTVIIVLERSLDKTFFVFWMGFIRKLDFKKLDKINLTFFVSNLMKVKKLETRYYGYFYYRYQEINTGDYWSWVK